MDHRVRQAIETMKANLQRRHTVATLARPHQLSPSRFAHLFRQETGTSPIQFLKALRLATAKTLLESTDLGIKEVMLNVGFVDKSHFERDFRRVYHVTPKRHREISQQHTHHNRGNNSLAVSAIK